MNHLRQVTIPIIAVALLSAIGIVRADVIDTLAEIHCVGFDYPMDEELFMPVNKNRSALPLRAVLLDNEGGTVTDEDLASAPVVQVTFTSDEPDSEPELVDDEDLVSIHDADSGNLFVYMPLSQEWVFNLSARPLEAAGKYEISMVSGDLTEYVIQTDCISTFSRVQ